MARTFRTQVARRFQRAVRIDADFRSKDALADYVPLPISLAALARMGEQIANSSQRAFTWTGPYGGGKSSLALLLGSLLDEDTSVRRAAHEVVGSAWASKIQKAFHVRRTGWLVIPVVGQRDSIVRMLDVALTKALKNRFRGRLPKSVSEEGGADSYKYLDRLTKAAAICSGDSEGILIVIDEMGRFLEHSAATNGDLSFLQELAEIVGRLKEKVVIVGVLHQAFEQYASKLGSDGRDEWAKIQGRFVDVPLTTGPEDTVRLISQALVGDQAPKEHSAICLEIASILKERRAGLPSDLAELLRNCWPLHPLVALLLASVSRKRFGQNERSTFGFLNSGEPGGFQEFLNKATDRDELYGLEEFWNYLRLNLEPAILASSDGHRWSQAVEAVDRAESKGEKAHVVLAKAIATLDLFGNQVGLYGDDKLIRNVLLDSKKREGAQLLDDLRAWSTVIFRAYNKSWAVFAGSDFDIDSELAAAKSRIEIDYAALQNILTQQVIIAKKHYYETGTLRWFDVRISAVEDFAKLLQAYRPMRGACGLFALGLPKGRESSDVSRVQAELLSEQPSEFPFILGVSSNASDVRILALELAAIEHVLGNVAALEGDEVARRELAARSANAREQLDQKMSEMLGAASWYSRGELQRVTSVGDLSRLASDRATELFKNSPIIKNELINRAKPSSNAISAANELMRLMVVKSDQENLGIDGYPPHRAIYESILVSPGFHRRDRQTKDFKFDAPNSGAMGRTFAAMWAEGESFLDETKESRRPLSDLYEKWARAPFGIRYGVIPIYALAFILANESKLALYLDSQFVPELDTFFVDRLLQSPTAIHVRKFEIAGVARFALERLSLLVSEHSEGELSLDALSVAKPLVAFVRSLHPWVKRTRLLSATTLACRDSIAKASDPIALLFEELPTAFGGKSIAYSSNDRHALGAYIESLRLALDELRSAYPKLLDQITIHLGDQLNGSFADKKGRFNISERASAVAGIGGDFRLDSFATRLKTASDSVEWIESIVGLAANKPIKDWIDNDIDRAKFEISDLSARFKRVEHVANTVGRQANEETVAIVIGQGTDTQSIIKNVQISVSEKELAKEILGDLLARLSARGLDHASLVSVVTEIAKSVIVDQHRTGLPESSANLAEMRRKTWN